MPYNCSVHVPPTTKSFVSIGQPIRSIVAMYGSPVFLFRPATIGSTKYGPNLEKLYRGTLKNYSGLQKKFCHTPVGIEYVWNHVHEKFLAASVDSLAADTDSDETAVDLHCAVVYTKDTFWCSNYIVAQLFCLWKRTTSDRDSPLYMFTQTAVKSYRAYTVWTSVASPGRPTNRVSFSWNTFWKLVETVCACTPNLLSAAMATHSLPIMATMAAPLYSIID